MLRNKLKDSAHCMLNALSKVAILLFVVVFPHVISFIHTTGMDSYSCYSSRHSGQKGLHIRTSFHLHDIAQTQEETVVFAGVKFRHPVTKAFKNLDIQNPSPIQQAGIAPLTAGMSCILHAATGTGKTLTFVLPLLKRLYGDPDGIKIPLQALIVAPTKELAIQV